MRSKLIAFNILLILSINAFSTISYADGNEGRIFKGWFESKNPGVSPVKFQQYNEICGSCHFPYQPGLLPAVSWQKIMSNTEKHFGAAIKLSPVEARTINRYLLDNSAGHVNDEVSYNILHSLKYDPIVMRITKTPYFIKVHNQLNGDDKVKNIGECNSCHKDAAQGKY